MLKDNVYADSQFYSIGYDSLPSSSSSVCQIQDHVIKTYHPYKSSPIHYCFGFLGSCNGLICLWYYCCYKILLCLWNPATGEFKELPESPIGFRESNACMYGLGYDTKTGDYKLAVGVNVKASGSKSLVQVYTLASNLWKMEKTIPYYWLSYMETETSGVLVNGNLHWLALGGHSNVLLSLDISDENFKELQLPTEMLEMNRMDLCLGVLKGCLCLFVSSDVDGVKIHSVWEMLDYGLQESWTKRYVIANESIIDEHAYFRRVQSSGKDEILLWGRDILVLYDPRHGSARKLEKGNTTFRNAETYFESLVSMNSGTYVVGERKRASKRNKSLNKKLKYF